MSTGVRDVDHNPDTGVVKALIPSPLLLASVWLFVSMLAVPSIAQVVIPEPVPPPDEPPAEVRIESVDVNTTIDNQVAVTEVTQVIDNPTHHQVEGEYLFPLPKDARVTDFTMSVNGEPVTGEILDEDQARQIYERIVRRQDDPGFLRYVGQGALKVNIFPIEAQQKRTLEIEYQQTLTGDNGQVEYHLPLDIAQKQRSAPEAVTVNVTIKNRSEIKTVRSPSHSITLDRDRASEVTAHFSAESDVPNRDFQLFYTTGDDRFGIDGMAYRDNDEPGFFSLSVTPSYEQNLSSMPKDIVFVVDVSGSMRSDQKIDQVKQSLDYIVGSLNPEDRFSVVSFSSTTEIFRESLRDATSDQKQSARQFIDNLSATGSTNLHGAITKALGMDPGRSERPFMVVLLTDGKPTAGQTTDPDEIIEAAGDANRRDARLFTVGVGYDVNSIFLDKLVEQHHGDRVYVTPDENLESRLSTFYGKIANPVLSELSLSIDGVRTRDVYPVRLPDLFKGSQLVLHGRYLGHGSVDVTLKGRRGGETVTIRRTINFPERRTDHDFLPRSWARVKIGHLIHQIRQHGMNDELKEELTRLSKEYGIVTEYTASLILEDEEMARAPQFRELRQEYSSRRDQLNRARDKAMSVGEGQASVRAAKQAQRFSSGEAMVEDEKGETSRTHIKQVGPKTFYRSGGIWYDRQYDEEESVEQIIYGGDRYFRLLERHPGLGRYFSLGKNVIVEYEGTFYHVRPRGETR